MAQTIEFTRIGGGWEHTFTSKGAVAVQMNTVSAGRIFVFASFPGMEPSLVGELDNSFGSSYFGIDLPAGTEVTIRSAVDVSQAMIENAQD